MTSNINWVARVDFESADDLSRDEDAIDFIFEHLGSECGPVISKHSGDGLWELTFSVHAPTLDAAVTHALELMAVATGATPSGVEVQPEQVFDRRAEWVRPSVKVQT